MNFSVQKQDVKVRNVKLVKIGNPVVEIVCIHGILRKKNNKLRIEVRNLDANRIIWLDKNKVPWQTFFLVDVAYRNFDASHWESVPSGLLGPVELKCCR